MRCNMLTKAYHPHSPLHDTPRMHSTAPMHLMQESEVFRCYCCCCCSRRRRRHSRPPAFLHSQFHELRADNAHHSADVNDCIECELCIRVAQPFNEFDTIGLQLQICRNDNWIFWEGICASQNFVHCPSRRVDARIQAPSIVTSVPGAHHASCTPASISNF